MFGPSLVASSWAGELCVHGVITMLSMDDVCEIHMVKTMYYNDEINKIINDY